jgi:hypothetical protein
LFGILNATLGQSTTLSGYKFVSLLAV